MKWQLYIFHPVFFLKSEINFGISEKALGQEPDHLLCMNKPGPWLSAWPSLTPEIISDALFYDSSPMAFVLRRGFCLLHLANVIKIIKNIKIYCERESFSLLWEERIDKSLSTEEKKRNGQQEAASLGRLTIFMNSQAHLSLRGGHDKVSSTVLWGCLDSDLGCTTSCIFSPRNFFSCIYLS